VLYEDGTRIDYNYYPVELLTRAVEAPALPRDLDLGYRVLVDKDGLTQGIKPPSHTSNIPSPPTAAQFREVVEGFWWDTTYVAKFLRRDELFFAHASLRYAREGLLRMLEWRVEIDNNWSLPIWVRGRQMKRRLSPEMWAEVEGTFAAASVEENWEALFRLTRLFGRIAAGVAVDLGYSYPHDLDERVTAYLSRVRRLEM
jgi:aminoglycoside 6-adenylyltransferase